MTFGVNWSTAKCEVVRYVFKSETTVRNQIKLERFLAVEGEFLPRAESTYLGIRFTNDGEINELIDKRSRQLLYLLRSGTFYYYS